MKKKKPKQSKMKTTIALIIWALIMFPPLTFFILRIFGIYLDPHLMMIPLLLGGCLGTAIAFVEGLRKNHVWVTDTDETGEQVLGQHKVHKKKTPKEFWSGIVVFAAAFLACLGFLIKIFFELKK